MTVYISSNAVTTSLSVFFQYSPTYNMRKFFHALAFFSTFAALVLLVFIILNGVTVKAPFNNMYWSAVQLLDGEVFRYTNYGLCGVSNQHNSNCTPNQFAFGYKPVTDIKFNNSILQSKTGTFYYLSKIGCIFLIVAAAVALIAFGLLTLTTLTRSRFFHILTVCVIVFGFIFNMAAAIMETYLHVFTTQKYKSDGFNSDIGSVAFGILWGSVSAYLLSVVSIAILSCSQEHENSGNYVAEIRYPEDMKAYQS